MKKRVFGEMKIWNYPLAEVAKTEIEMIYLAETLWSLRRILQDWLKMRLVVLMSGWKSLSSLWGKTKEQGLYFCCYKTWNKSQDQKFPLMLSWWPASIERNTIVFHYLFTLAKVRETNYMKNCGEKKCKKPGLGI